MAHVRLSEFFTPASVLMHFHLGEKEYKANNIPAAKRAYSLAIQAFHRLTLYQKNHDYHTLVAFATAKFRLANGILGNNVKACESVFRLGTKYLVEAQTAVHKAQRLMTTLELEILSQEIKEQHDTVNKLIKPISPIWKKPEFKPEMTALDSASTSPKSSSRSPISSSSVQRGSLKNFRKSQPRKHESVFSKIDSSKQIPFIVNAVCAFFGLLHKLNEAPMVAPEQSKAALKKMYRLKL